MKIDLYPVLEYSRKRFKKDFTIRSYAWDDLCFRIEILHRSGNKLCIIRLEKNTTDPSCVESES